MQAGAQAGKGRKQILPRSLLKESALLSGTLVLPRRHLSRISHLQNCQGITVYCLKSPSQWWLVLVALRHQHSFPYW